MIVEYKITQNEILQIVERLCENSIYAYKKQLCEGYITIRGGHRVGITGTTVVENGEIINIKYITSLNFKIVVIELLDRLSIQKIKLYLIH